MSDEELEAYVYGDRGLEHYLITATASQRVEAKADFAITSAMKTKHPPGPPMTLGNRRELGVRDLAKIAQLFPGTKHPQPTI
jgi:hypothetical protein